MTDATDLSLAFLKSAISEIAELGSVEIRPGLIIEKTLGGLAYAQVGGKVTEASDIPNDIADEIRDAARKQRDEKAGAERQKYLDPAQNPLIRRLPED
jgi:hypothetical protein